MLNSEKWKSNDWLEAGNSFSYFQGWNLIKGSSILDFYFISLHVCGFTPPWSYYSFVYYWRLENILSLMITLLLGWSSVIYQKIGKEPMKNGERSYWEFQRAIKQVESFYDYCSEWDTCDNDICSRFYNFLKV